MTFDTLAVSRALTAAGIGRDHADAIAAGIATAAEHGDHVTVDRFAAGLAQLETRLLEWVLGIALAVAGVQTAILVAALRFFTE